jgi:site-specific DNA-cytosine methylase
MKILSLFDGVATARVALDRAGIKVDKYYSSEIYPQAIAVSEYNYPGQIERLGSVTDFEQWNLGEIDLLIGGSPCIDLSVAMKDREGL